MFDIFLDLLSTLTRSSISININVDPRFNINQVKYLAMGGSITATDQEDDSQSDQADQEENQEQDEDADVDI